MPDELTAAIPATEPAWLRCPQCQGHGWSMATRPSGQLLFKCTNVFCGSAFHLDLYPGDSLAARIQGRRPA